MEQTQELEIIKCEHPSKFKRFLTVLLVTILLLAGAVYAAGVILIKGPSPYAGREFVRAVGDNPAARVALLLYMTDGEIEAVLQGEEAPRQYSVYPVVE